MYEDIINTAQVVQASDRDRMIVRMSIFVDAPKTGTVKASFVSKDMGMRVTCADLAEFRLEQAPTISN